MTTTTEAGSVPPVLAGLCVTTEVMRMIELVAGSSADVAGTVGLEIGTNEEIGGIEVVEGGRNEEVDEITEPIEVADDGPVDSNRQH